MRRSMMRFGLALAAVLLVVLVALPAAKADTYQNGYVNDAGYTYKDGYWWYGGKAYKYESYWVAGYTYYQNGCYYQKPGYYAYKYVEYPVAATPAAVTAADPDWRVKLLEIAGNRDKLEGAARKGAAEQKYFLDAVTALGLQGNFRWDGYGAAPAGYVLPNPGGVQAVTGGYNTYGTYVPTNGVYTHQYQLGFHGAQASTVYGSTYQQLAQLYGDNSLPQLYQQANRLTENAQKLGGDANAGFQALVQTEGSNRARVAEILARGEAVKQFLSSLDGPGSIETKSFQFGTGEPKTFLPPPPAGVAQPLTANPRKAQFEALFAAKCASCHTGTTAKGKFTLAAYYGFTAEQKLETWKLLVTSDKDKVMPRKADGAAGERLSLEEVKLFTEN